jgi:hypothetical protein
MSVACAKTDKPAAAPDTAAALAPAAPAAPAALALADVAGKWNVVSRNEKGDSLVTYTLTATADTSGWSIQFPGRKDMIPMHVTPSGDSLIMSAGPFTSGIRKDITVRTTGSYRLQDGKLGGRTIAHYDVKTADSVLVLIPSGTRIP